MGHRSSKLVSAGPLTNGNTSNTNKSSTKDTSSSTKLSKRSTRRHSSRYPKSRSANSESNKSYRHSIASLNSNSTNVAAVYEDQFLPLLRLNSGDPIVKDSDLTTVANNSSGQIIIKIRFKTHPPGNMDNTVDKKSSSTDSETTSSQIAVARSESCRRSVDKNSNKVARHLDNVGILRAACSYPNSSLNHKNTGTSITTTNTNNDNNNRASLPVHLNALRITEPLLDQEITDVGTAEYYEITEEEASTSTSSRRQKVKSVFMNFKSILESSGSNSGGSKSPLNKLSHSNSNNNNNNNSNFNHIHSIPHKLPISTTAVQMQTTTATLSSASSSNIYHDTPLSNATATTSTSLTPTPLMITTSMATLPPTHNTATNQLAIWATNKDVIIFANNLGSVTLEPLIATEPVAENGTGNVNCTAADHLSRRDPTNTALWRRLSNLPAKAGPIVHSQVDFVHYLVPDLERIFNSSFYWGKMDRYEAERLLEGKPEGTFLLRDSAQEEYLFSVTFRKYGRSLHARIEQSGHNFSFDCHDPAVFSTSTVTGLLEHYKDPGSVMFFEPMLTVPFHRKTVFSLQQLARAAIVSNANYDGLSKLELPVRLKAYLKEYHYKEKLRVKLLDETILACT